MVLTYHEAAGTAARWLHDTHWRSTGSANWALTPTACQRCMTQAADILEAVGYADLLAKVNLDECSICSEADGVRADGTYNAGWAEAMRFAHHAHADQTFMGYPSANGVLGHGPDAVIVDGDWLVHIEASRRNARAEVERLRAYIDTQPYLSDWDGLLVERDELRAERDALAATLARVEVEGDRCSNSTNYTVQFAGGLIREALRPPADDDEDVNSQSGRDLEQPGSSDDPLQWVLDCTLGEAATANPELTVQTEAVAYTVTRDRVDRATAAGVQAAGFAFENARITFKYDLGHAMVAILSTLGIKVKS